MHESFKLRPATVADCGEIAELYRIASEGVADYIWTKLAKTGEDIIEVGRRRYAREDSVFSYRNCVIVEHEGSVAGMLVSFPLHVDSDYREMDPILRPYSVLEQDDSYYICGMAMKPEFRGQGVGSHLLKLAETRALELGYSKLSLIVYEQNIGAHRLYLKNGFHEVARQAVVPHSLIRCSGDALLMVRELHK